MTRATGLGSWPGDDVRDVQHTVRDLFAPLDLPYLPELPTRGPGADLIGRSAALLVDLAVDLQPIGWRLVDRPGRDLGRARSFLRADLDELAETFDGYAGELKVQVAGPWTLAASIWLHRGERVVVDPGAVRDLTASLAEGVREHLAEVERLLPGATLVLQVDEPSLPAVLAGRLPTASGFGRITAVDSYVAANAITQVLAAAGERTTVVHCCAKGAPLPLLRSTGASALAVDLGQLGPKGWESLAATIESGTGVWLGALATDGSGPDTVGAAHDHLVARWRELGLPVALLADQVVSPACGLATLSPVQARTVARRTVELARALTETALS